MFAEAGALMILLPPIFEAPGGLSCASRVWTPISLPGRSLPYGGARTISFSMISLGTISL
jgi:hypothetical protein